MPQQHGTRPMPDTASPSTVEVRSSSIDGLGLFALRSFNPGQLIRIVNVVREVTAEAPLRPELGERRDHCDYPDGKVFLIGPPDRHLNHSCDPNAWVRYEGEACQIVARRDIRVGEEITCDYAINITGGDVWPCHCGTTRCRRRVVGDYFQLPREVQREYAPHLADWFRRKHGEALRMAGIEP
jgi:SET domain-containing protein